jgi:hypothetical protein
MRDDYPTQTGVLDGWSIDRVTTVPSLPRPQRPQLVSINVAQRFPDASSPGLLATFNVSGIESFIVDATSHRDPAPRIPADLNIYLTSPQGTTVPFRRSTCGPRRQRVSTGPIWDDSAPFLRLRDYPYVNLVNGNPSCARRRAVRPSWARTPNGTYGPVTCATRRSGDAGTLLPPGRWTSSPASRRPRARAPARATERPLARSPARAGTSARRASAAPNSFRPQRIEPVSSRARSTRTRACSRSVRPCRPRPWPCTCSNDAIGTASSYVRRPVREPAT